MTNLSPTAQAVLWAGLGRGSDRLVISAALRAAINQCQNGQGVISAVDLHLIASELETQP
jgi:hypothetical protein